jgi:hypothetical protein
MKKYLIITFCSLLFAFTSCKKALDINVDKTYVEEGVSASSLGFGGIWVTLMPDGKADLLPGGDIVERGTYEINGKNLTVTLSDQTFKFFIISDTELRYEGTRVLKFVSK